MNNKYSAKIISSSRELTKRERVKYREYKNYELLPDLIKVSPDFSFEPDLCVVIQVHNEYRQNDTQQTDYEVYLFVDRDGAGFYTSSSSFYDSYCEIMSEMEDEEVQIGVKIVQSRNFSGSFYKAILL